MEEDDHLALIKVRRKLSLDEAAALHGHRGPWLILGYKAGERAVEVLRPEDEKDLACLVKCPLKLPYTCAIDGIQASSKCTLGKLNLKVEDSGHIEFIFKDRRDGAKLILRPKRGLVKSLSEADRGELTNSLEEADPCELFEEERA